MTRKIISTYQAASAYSQLHTVEPFECGPAAPEPGSPGDVSWVLDGARGESGVAGRDDGATDCDAPLVLRNCCASGASSPLDADDAGDAGLSSSDCGTVEGTVGWGTSASDFWRLGVSVPTAEFGPRPRFLALVFVCSASFLRLR